MTLKNLLTTGEVAQLLNISRSTVSRKFDKGVFKGQKNPITGERLISRESLNAFVEQYSLALDTLAVEKKKILIGTADEALFSLLQKMFPPEGRQVQLERVEFGCDVLIHCSKEHPDLLIIDEELSDIPSAEVIKSLRRMDEQKELKILCFSKSLGMKQCLDWGADEVLLKDVGAEELTEKLHHFLAIPEERPTEAQSFEHQRRWPRIPIRIPAKISVYRLKTPYFREAGKAVLENISYGGSYLSGIELEKGILPAVPFRLLLEVDQPPLTNWRAHCKLVRLQSNGSLTAGVQFMRLSRANRKALEAVASP